ncbi:MAG: DNA repair protein RecO [Rhodospirillales bacterium]
MEWHDSGFVLASRKHGESSIILTLFTAQHGRHLGLVRGGAGKRARGIYEAGNLVSAHWRARISDHLGAFTCELIRPKAALLMDSPLKLAGLSAACALAAVTLPERVAEAPLFGKFAGLLDAFETEDCPGNWPAIFVQWEIDLLAELGFGLDLSHCAATGRTDDLCYVSPRTGRSVSRDAGAPYADQLLPLPGFLLDSNAPAADWREIAAGLNLTGYFIEHHVLTPHQQKMPAARERFCDRVRGKAAAAVTEQA